ncbi:unnamed protein product, partial [Adineta steineri]
MDPRKQSSTRKQSPSQLTTAYLLIYNSVLTIGWTLILFETIKR